MSSETWVPPPVEEWDPTHNPTQATANWSTSNFGEAMPGVLTPLGWTFWGPVAERAIRGAFYSMGALSKPEFDRTDSFGVDPLNRTLNAFFGRVAGRVDFFCEMGDRLPGTSAAAIAEQIVGAAPPGMVSNPTRRRYPILAVRFPMTFARIPRQLRRAQQATDAWWKTKIDHTAKLPMDQAIAQFNEAWRRFEQNVVLDGVHALCAMQPLYDQLAKLVAEAGMPDANAFMSGYGGMAESAVVEDLWLASQGRMEFDEVARRHGYHGPNEGDISGVVWREDPTPLRKLLASYRENAKQGVSEGEAARREKRLELERQLLAALPAHRRASARLLLRLTRASVPLRGVGKAAFLQSLDMARAAARRIGQLLVSDGTLGELGDVFYLTAEEIGGRMPADSAELVARRRARREQYLEVTLPSAWTGMPEALPIGRDDEADAAEIDVLRGVGASPGVVEGPVRVVRDPAANEFESGEILVSTMTDPSWAAVMYVSKALVVDIGGPIGHAAIVARELGVPCVVNTRDGTRVLRTGDICRVDGTSGEVRVLERGARPAPSGDRVETPNSGALRPEHFAILRVLRLKGRSSAEGLVSATGLNAETVTAAVGALVQGDQARQVGETYVMLPAAREALGAALEAERLTVEETAVEELYEDFTPVNQEFKELVASWQERDGEANDHSDEAYDNRVLERLPAIHDRVVPVAARAGELALRLRPYRERFERALERVEAGDREWFLKPLMDSYHTVWFEFHEELISLAGRSREAEATAGRAE